MPKAALASLVLASLLIACSGEGTQSSSAAVTVKCGAPPNGPVQGYDVSVYQGNFNWAGTNVQFGYARIGDGAGYIDSTFDGNWARMKAAGVLRGGYQFFEPSESEVTQANIVVSKLGQLGDGDLPAMIDLEVTDGQSPGTIAYKVRHWLQIVEAGTGKRPVIYTGSYFWQDNIGDTTFGAYPIRIAAYGVSCPSLPAGWSNWTFWQYSDGGGALDHDVFNGSLAELQAMAGTPAPPPPPPPARGSLDSVTCDSISGWAQDPSAPGTPIPVDIYVDGPAGQGTSLGRFTAGNARPDLCGAIGSCNHAFDVQPPATLYDGHAHGVYAYGISVTQGAPNALLGGSPKTLHCAKALTGNFDGSGESEVVQFRDDWTTLPRCGRWGSDWSCYNEPATLLGLGATGNDGSAIYAGLDPNVGDMNGDGRDDLVEFNPSWKSIPVCLATAHGGWACKDLEATYVGGAGAAGNGGSGVYPGTTPLVGDVNGDGKADVVEFNPASTTIPVCYATDEGWSCVNEAATYAGGAGAGNGGSGVYGGTQVFLADVNGDGKQDLVQFSAGLESIPVCFATDSGWSCENLHAAYIGGIGAGNGGSGVYDATVVRTTDMNGDGKADLVLFNDKWSSIPVCFATSSGWSCKNLPATYVGGRFGAGNAGSGVYAGSTTTFVTDINGDGLADVVQYGSGWQSIPVCFATSQGWSCENLAANATDSNMGGNGGSGIVPYGVPLVGRFTPTEASVVEIDPDSGWNTLPLCSILGQGWSCSNSSATVY